MLYTLSQSHYDLNQLAEILRHIHEQDALLLWQDGVLQAVKYPDFFANIQNVFVLEQDLRARGLTTDLPQISLQKLVQLCGQFYPQMAL